MQSRALPYPRSTASGVPDAAAVLSRRRNLSLSILEIKLSIFDTPCHTACNTVQGLGKVCSLVLGAGWRLADAGMWLQACLGAFQNSCSNPIMAFVVSSFPCGTPNHGCKDLEEPRGGKRRRIEEETEVK